MKNKKPDKKLYDVRYQVFDTEEDLEMAEDALELGALTPDDLIDADL